MFIAGGIGAVAFFIFSLIAFTVVKLVYRLSDKGLHMSKYNIGAVVAIFIILGFIYGAICYNKRNYYYRLFKTHWSIFLINLVFSAGFAFITYILLKYQFKLSLGVDSFIIVFIVYFILYYLFSALFYHAYIAYNSTPAKKSSFKKSNWVYIILFNPVFVALFFFIFMAVVYDAIYIPCGVSIVGVDHNINTMNTQNLQIQYGQKLISIDGQPMYSMDQVKYYLNSIESTKEVVVETQDHIYYIQTYDVDGQRYMGLILKEDICRRV